jgi:hypothetical protein
LLRLGHELDDEGLPGILYQPPQPLEENGAGVVSQ